MGRGMQYYFDTSLAVAMRNENVFFDIPGTTPDHLPEGIGHHRIEANFIWHRLVRVLAMGSQTC